MINVQQLINEAVEANNVRTGGVRNKTKFHVSDAGTCYRKRYFKRLGIERDHPILVGALRKMLAGDAGHLMLQDILHKYRKLFAAEGVVETEHIKGHFDGILKDGDAKSVLEIKTIEKWGMTHIKRDGAKPEHLLQMFTYWGFLRNDYTSLNQATIIYVKREDFEGKQFDYTWSEDIAKKVADEWLPLLKYWDKQEVPPCTCSEDYGGHGVTYCPFANEDKTACCSLELLEAHNRKEAV